MGKGVYVTISRLALIAAMALAILAPGLGAQSQATYKGQFNLPFDARWGQVSMGAGDYRLEVSGFSSQSTVNIWHGNKNLGRVLLQSFDSFENKSQDATLVCIRHDGTCSVRALMLPQIGTFYFSVPQDAKHLVAQQPELLESIHVKTAGM